MLLKLQRCNVALRCRFVLDKCLAVVVLLPLDSCEANRQLFIKAPTHIWLTWLRRLTCIGERLQFELWLVLFYETTECTSLIFHCCLWVLTPFFSSSPLFMQPPTSTPASRDSCRTMTPSVWAWTSRGCWGSTTCSTSLLGQYTRSLNFTKCVTEIWLVLSFLFW